MTKHDSITYSIGEAGAALTKAGGEFTTLFRQGTLEIEIYRPVGIDRQQPHKKDEVYVVINGSGTFEHAGRRTVFHEGDSLPILRRGYSSTGPRAANSAGSC